MSPSAPYSFMPVLDNHTLPLPMVSHSVHSGINNLLRYIRDMLPI